MVSKKVFFLSLLSIFFILSIMNSVFSACDLVPTQIKIYSGSHYLGKFNSGSQVFINPDLSSNPIKVEFFFVNNETCFSSKNDMSMRLFPSASQLYATNFNSNTENGTNYAEFDFVFSADVTLSNSFTSTFNVNVDSGYSGSFNFGIDNTGPIFTTFETPSKKLFSPGSTIQISYGVQDLQSGLEMISISGGNSKIINFNSNNKTYSGVFSDNISSTQAYSFKVYDKLGHETEKNVTLYVDGNPPQISNLDKSYSFQNSIRRVTFSLKIKDFSYQFLSGNFIPNIVGDFSAINPEDSSMRPTSCEKSSMDNETFTCYFSNIEIKLKNTTSVNLKFNAEDSLGNKINKTFRESIFVDYDGPKILEFYLINGNGVKNLFSAYDNSSIVYLKFSDASIDNKDLFAIPPSVIPKFGKINFLTTDNCSNVGENTKVCVWNLKNKVAVYSLNKNGSDTFEITVIDKYGNPSHKAIKVYYDNVLPVVKNITFVEKTSIKDGIIQSGEKVDFDIFIKDSNMDSGGKYFVKGLFNQIDFDSNFQNWTDGVCHPLNSTITKCVFSGIQVANGYLNRTVFFKVYDAARNGVIAKYNVTIYKVANESNKIFIQNKKFDILNPINRNTIKESSVRAWFVGNLEFAKGFSPKNYKIINYQLKSGSCNASVFHRDWVIDNSLYPDDIVYGTGNYNEDRNFTMFVDLSEYPNFNEMNDKNMTCTMSVLYRDSTTIYPPELVNFTLVFGFYALPRGNIIQANAQNILDKINSIGSMGNFFDKLYHFYHFFDKVCTTVNSANSILGTVSSAWTGISQILWATGLGSSIAGPIDSTVFTGESGISSLLSSAKSVVNTMCLWVTCKNGGIIGSMMHNNQYFKTIPGLKQLYDTNNMISDAVCSAGSSLGSKIGSGGNS